MNGGLPGGPAGRPRISPCLGLMLTTSDDPDFGTEITLKVPFLVKKWRFESKIKESVTNDPASIGNANQTGSQGMRIVQRGPLTVVKNEAVNRVIRAKV